MSTLRTPHLDILTPNSGAEGARIHTVEDVASVVDVLQQHGHNEIDTARVYGTSEALLGQLKWQERGLLIDTKLNPRRMGPYQYSHKKEDLKRCLLDSLQALNSEKVDLFYLHAPDVSRDAQCSIATYLMYDTSN